MFEYSNARNYYFCCKPPLKRGQEFKKEKKKEISKMPKMSNTK
jgi:hypothetical protein